MFLCNVSSSSLSSSDTASRSDAERTALSLWNRLSALSTIQIIVIALVIFLLLMLIMELLRSKYALTVTKRFVPVKDLPETFDGTKVIVLSDLHQMRFGEYNAELAKRIKREEPDYIFFVGDMGDSRRFNVDAFYDLLENLGDSIPFIMVPGNHDLRLGGGTVHKNFIREVERFGAVILTNTCAEMVSGGHKLYIYGFCQPLKAEDSIPAREWSFSDVSDGDVAALLGKCPSDAPSILLAHDPRPFQQYEEWGAKLVLAGHLHGGGIRLPFLGGVIGPDRTFFPKYSSGLFTGETSSMFVTRGLASPGLLRFMNPPEIAVLTLTCQDSELLNRLPEPIIAVPKFTLAKDDIPAEENAAAITTGSRSDKNKKYSSSKDTSPVDPNANSFQRFIHNVKAKFSAAGDWIKSEHRSIRELLDERLNQVADFFALMFGKKRSKYAKAADEAKKRNTYIAPKKKKPQHRYGSGQNYGNNGDSNSDENHYPNE